MKNSKVIIVLKEIVLWAMSLYLAWLFVKQGYVKFDAEGFWSGAFERWGYPVWFMFLIGFLECLGAILILIPRTGAYGGTILAVIMTGAFITRSIHGASTADLVWIFLFGLGGGLIAWGRFKQRLKLRKS